MTIPIDEVRPLVDLRDRGIQKMRIAVGNRLSAIERGVDVPTNGSTALWERYDERLKQLEAEMDADIREAVKDIAIVAHMVRVKGVGLMLSAKVVSMVDITRASTVSALWRYAGYGVKDGEREKPIKGEKLHYNARLK